MFLHVSRLDPQVTGSLHWRYRLTKVCSALHLRFQFLNFGRDISDELEVDVRRRCGSNARSVLRLPDGYMGQTAKAHDLTGQGIDSLDQV